MAEANDIYMYDDQISDEILLMASQQYEESSLANGENEQESLDENKCRFASPLNTARIQEVREMGVPLKTRQATTWLVNAWKAWVQERE
jgi:hypothetical protein